MKDKINEQQKAQNKIDAQKDFEKALFDNFFSNLVTKLQKNPSTLLSLNEIKKRFLLTKESYKGIQTVQINKIMGSEGRYSDFDQFFNPKSSKSRGKWLGISEAMRNGVSLPPVQLYKVDDLYFVRDGNHRISVAKKLGQKFIEAEVTEFDSPVKLTKKINLKTLLVKQEYTDFLEVTGLKDVINKDNEIDLTELGGYDTILFHIKAHKYFLEVEKGFVVSYEASAKSWFENLYLPFIKIIKKVNIYTYFSKRTPADLYIWILNHKQFIFEEFGETTNINETVKKFIEKYSQADKTDVKKLVKTIKSSKSVHRNRKNKTDLKL